MRSLTYSSCQVPGATPAASSPERQAHWFSMTVTHRVSRGHSRNAFFFFFCCLFVLGLPGKGEEELGREGGRCFVTWGLRPRGQEDRQTRLPPRALPAHRLPARARKEGTREGREPRKARGPKATSILPLTSFCPTSLQVCYKQEILGCILIKQWNFYFFFS